MWEICEGSDAESAVTRWSGPESYHYSPTAPDEGPYEPLEEATGTAIVTLGQLAQDYLASYDSAGNLVRSVPKSDVPIKTDGLYTLSGKVQEGSGVASGEDAHAEGGSTASGLNSHAEGTSSMACGTYAHAEGSSGTAGGSYPPCAVAGAIDRVFGLSQAIRNLADASEAAMIDE